MRIFWLSNRFFSEKNDTSTGTWLTAMGQALVASGKVHLANISQDEVSSVTRRDCNGIVQWVVPFGNSPRDGLPSRRIVSGIQQAVAEFAPDLIHVWGTENYWGLLTARKILPGKTLLDMQGIKFACARVYNAGFTSAEILRCLGLKELLRPRLSVPLSRRSFQAWGVFEREMIKGHRFISSQSDWVSAHVRHANPGCRMLKSDMMLRPEFLSAGTWSPPAVSSENPPVVFTSCGCTIPYKGLHVLLRAVALVKRWRGPVMLRIAGCPPRSGIRKGGYERFVEQEIRRLGLEADVRWVGALDASGLIREMKQSSVVVIPSFVESYSLALCEAMQVGAPCVVSFAGAMPEMARHEESALFFPPGDPESCAWQIERIVGSRDLALELSLNARNRGLARHKPDTLLTRQLENYREAMED